MVLFKGFPFKSFQCPGSSVITLWLDVPVSSSGFYHGGIIAFVYQ